MDSYRIDTLEGEAFVCAVMAKDGLMVHLAHLGTALAREEGPWRITQISTGHAVAKSGRDSEQACRCLEALLPVTDWTVNLEGILKVLPEIKHAARKVIATHSMRPASYGR